LRRLQTEEWGRGSDRQSPKISTGRSKAGSNISTEGFEGRRRRELAGERAWGVRGRLRGEANLPTIIILVAGLRWESVGKDPELVWHIRRIGTGNLQRNQKDRERVD